MCLDNAEVPSMFDPLFRVCLPLCNVVRPVGCADAKMQHSLASFGHLLWLRRPRATLSVPCALALLYFRSSTKG